MTSHARPGRISGVSGSIRRSSGESGRQDRYTGRLETCFRRIAEGRARSRSFSARYPQVRVTRCEHHYVFYVQPEGQKPLIFAVLHERMDMLTRIGERLSR